jgi:hypothetical protein
MSTLKFEVGKSYQTRDGRKAVCLTTTLCDDYPIGIQIDDSLYRATSDGYDYVTKSQSPKDIISEWIDKPVIDWSAMPAWAKFVAMDKNKKWFWYTSEVSLLVFGNWDLKSGGRSGVIPTEYAPKWEGDWKQSLIERP